uniref:PIN domain nuclease n=1 Tax=Paractinoplanes polyasparticus TaxID=2856853 RepID=UPI001C844B23|nr:PIN domain nuclease [Actinoplanes polyasparticus]
MSQASYLVDTSAHVRLTTNPGVRAAWDHKVRRGTLVVCPLSELEILFSAKSREHREEMIANLRESYRWVVMPDRAFERAEEVQQHLADQGRHRAVGPLDLLVAATAEEHEMVLLHYDKGFECVSEVTGQRVQWLAEPGSIS